MKFLIAGFGSIGRRHFNNLLRLGQREIIFYRTHHSTLPDDSIAEYPIETSLSGALAHHPDAVIITNPTALHLDVALPAAEAGCSLLIEKPISDSLVNLEKLSKVVQDGPGEVLVGFQFRFHPNLKHIREILQEETIGRPLAVRSHWGEYLPAWHPWEDYRESYSARRDLGGGVLLTLCHPFDYLRWLFGEVEQVWSLLGYNSDLDIDVEDTAEVGLKFASGMVGSLHLNYTQIPAKHSLEIVGTQGTIFWDYYRSTVVVNTSMESGDIKTVHHAAADDFERNQLFLSEMEHFLQVVAGEAAPLCTLEDGIRALELALQAQEGGMP